MSDSLNVEFFRMIRTARAPMRAKRAAAGLIPGRALRYCDALTTATSFGYWVFPPMDLRLIFDGEQIFWSYGEDERWLPLSATGSGAVQFPNYAAEFDETAPAALRGYSPPFLTALAETGNVQMWTGLLARCRPGWGLSVRAPVNLPAVPGLVNWEGLVEADVWFGPLFTNFRFTKTDQPVYIRSHMPILQVQPVPQLAYREETLNAFSCRDADEMTASDWDQLGAVLLPPDDPNSRQGEYAVTVRKRRACPFDHSLLQTAIKA